MGARGCICCRDLPEQKRSQGRAEEHAQAISAELTHTARLALAGALTASIAHEITQPLTAIVMNAGAARAVVRGPHDEGLRQMLDDIAAEGRRAADVVQRLRALCRKQPLEMQVIDLNDIAHEALQWARSDASRRQVKLIAELAPALPRVRGDRVCLQQVLLNLLVNAMDAMQQVRSAERQLAVVTRPVEHGASFTVADVGHGIPPDTLARMFDAFFTTKAHGVGLGLSIARSIVEAHNGRIWAENRAPRGAAVHIVLPETRTSEARETGPEPPPPAA